MIGWLTHKINRLFLGVCIAIGNTAAHMIVSKRLSCKIIELRNKIHPSNTT